MKKASEKRNEKNLKNQSFLQKILELKTELFAQFSPTITKDSKKKAWTEIRDFAVSIGLIAREKDYNYVRDATWPNLRARTVAKVDRSSKTGTGGGPEMKLDATDLLVLEIIGKESPIFQGLGVKDSLGETPATLIIGPSCSFTQEKSAMGEVQNESEENEGLQKEFTKPRGPVKKKVIVQCPNDTKAIESLKRRKLELEVRKLELEVWEKENTLRVKHSPLTSGIEQLEDGGDQLGNVGNLIIDNGHYVINDEGKVVLVQEEIHT